MSYSHESLKRCQCNPTLVVFCAVLNCLTDIQAGQGLYFEALQNTWRAKNCTSNTYGVSDTTYGLDPSPCSSCPAGTTASLTFSNSRQYHVVNEDGTGGFTHERACVTKPGGDYLLWHNGGSVMLRRL
jgi:hypothetical protein